MGLLRCARLAITFHWVCLLRNNVPPLDHLLRIIPQLTAMNYSRFRLCEEALQDIRFILVKKNRPGSGDGLLNSV